MDTAVIFELASDGTIEFINEAITPLTGYQPDELIGQNWWRVFFPADQNSQVETLSAQIQSAYNAQMIQSIQAKDGTPVVLETYVARRTHPDGSPPSFLGSAVDSDERQRAQQTLLKSVERYQMLVEKMNEGVGVINANKVHTTTRKGFEEKPIESEARYRALFEDSPISLWEEDFSAVKAYIDDLRKKGISDFQAFFEQHPECVALCVSLVKITDVNKATLRVFKAKNKETLLAGLGNVVPPQSYNIFLQELVMLAEGYTKFEWEGVNQTLAGERIDIRLHWSAAPGCEDTLSKVFVSIEDITEQKRAEAELRESEARYRSLIENIPIGIYRTTPGPQGYYLMANPAFQNMFGFASFEELEKFAVADVYINPEERKEFSKTLLTQGEVAGVEYRLKKNDGTPLWGSVTARVVNDEIGEVAYFDCSIEDITERKQTELSLQHAEQRYRMLFEEAPVMYVVTRNEGDVPIITDCNAAFLHTLGYSPHEVLGCPLAEFYTTNSKTSLLGGGYQKAREGQIESEERRLVAKDGHIVETLLRAIPETDSHDHIIGTRAMYMDITERKRAEEALRMERNKAQSYLDIAGVMLIAFNERGEVSLINQEGCKILGYSEEEIIGQNWFDTCLPEGIREEVQSAFNELFAGEVTSHEYHENPILTRQGGERIIAWRNTLLKDETGYAIAVLSSGEDITERKQAEKELRKAHQLLETIFENTHVMVAFLDPQFNFVRVNRAYAQADDREPEFFPGKNHFDLYPNPENEVFFHQVIETGEPHFENSRPFEFGEHPGRPVSYWDWSLVPIKDPSGKVQGLIFTLLNVSERVQAEERVHHLAIKLKAIARPARQMSALLDANKLAQEVVNAMYEIMGCYNANFYSLHGETLFLIASRGERQEEMLTTKYSSPLGNGILGRVVRSGKAVLAPDTSLNPYFIPCDILTQTRSELAVPVISKDKVLGLLDMHASEANAFDDSDLEVLGILADQLAVSLENAKLFEQITRRTQELEVLAQVSSLLRIASTRSEMMPLILEQLVILFEAEGAAIIRCDQESKKAVVTIGVNAWENLTGQTLPPNWNICDPVFKAKQPFQNNAIPSLNLTSNPETTSEIQAIACVPLIVQEKNMGVLSIGRKTEITESEIRLLTAIADMTANAIHRATLHEQTQRYAEQMKTVSGIGKTLAETLDLSEIYPRLCQAVFELLPDVASILISIYNSENQSITCAYGMQDGKPVNVTELPSIPLAKPGQDTQSLVIHTHQPLIVNDLPNRLTKKIVVGSTNYYTQSALYVPMLSKGDVIGVVQVQSYTPERFSQSDAELLALVANTAAVTIENARLFSETRLRLQRMAALRAMDMAISSSFDLRVTLDVLLDQVSTHLNVDAACVLLFNPYSRLLDFAAGRGFRNGYSSRSNLRLDQSYAGQAALERKLVSIPDLKTRIKEQETHPDPYLESTLNKLKMEGFVAYHAIPLLAKGQVKGVLEVFHRSPLKPDQEWIEFLETLAGDTAIAIDNATLFNDMQRSHVELVLAYDTTLEGWSRALELRDQETEGHAQRVTEMTRQLCQALGMTEAELIQVRRGALLHDIGKMGIPDSILHKTGPLTEEEWKIMHKHPVYAQELLSPIPFLRPALDIPYYHHERWDGTGYPQGLKGEQIPLAARAFAIVDVWDALLSERPYRHPWPKGKVFEHIRQQSGRHFDPRVVDIFFELFSP